MSKTLDDNAIDQFDMEVKQAYQGAGEIRPTVRLRTGVVGLTHRFPKIGKGVATLRVPQTDVVPMNVQHTKVNATLEDWNAPEYTDIFDQQKVNYQERAALAFVIASALGRREDQLVIDALDAIAPTLTVSKDIGGVDTDWNVAKIRRCGRLLKNKGVPKKDKYILWSAIGEEALLGATEATSADFNSVRALVLGEIDTFVGFKFIMIEERDEGGLPLASTIRTGWAYHGGPMGSVGLAVGIDKRTEVNYIPEKTSWLANGLLTAGAVAIDLDGIVEVSTKEAP